MKLDIRVASLIVICGSVVSSGVVADGVKSQFGPNTRYTTIGGESFTSETGKDTRRFFNQSELYADGDIPEVAFSDCNMRAAVNLPSGVKLSRIELFGYDNSDLGTAIRLHQICRVGNNPPMDNIIADLTSDIPGTPGYFIAGENTDHTVNNNTCHYSLRAFRSFQGVAIFLGCGGQDARWVSTRLEWQRQTSPAPAVATFMDVPQGSIATGGHPFFAEIEALAASGITGGCGNGNYCPDNPITRGQFAAFFARALGLHWPDN